MNSANQNIVPAKRIDSYTIGDSLQNLLSSITNGYVIKELNSYFVVLHSYFKFWVLKENRRIAQIGVYKGFDGTYNGIGIGSTLSDIKKKYGSWCESVDIYLIPQQAGICFELEDNDIDEEWIQETAPIEAIYVYDPQVINTNIEFVYDIKANKYVDKVLVNN